MSKLISVVTINLNNRDGLLRTISSVHNQVSDKFEYIVVDGLSSDGSREVIENAEKTINKVLIERDSGISDAFNKGISISTGKYILLLNSGDTLVDTFTLDFVVECISREPNIDIFCFGAYVVRKNSMDYLMPRDLYSASHQAMFVSADLYHKIGGYSPSFTIRMDLEFFLRASKVPIALKLITYPVSHYEIGGISNQLKNRKVFNLEGLIAYYLHKNKIHFGYLIRYFWWRYFYRIARYYVEHFVR